ncbi:MAG: hypothetical protein FJ280_15640 [Planctomycetes bacterium]|nr:hypothetical protein [Planctomycetota bacterium]
MFHRQDADATTGGSGKRSLRSLPMADGQTIGKLRLPLPPTRKVNRREAPANRTAVQAFPGCRNGYADGRISGAVCCERIVQVETRSKRKDQKPEHSKRTHRPASAFRALEFWISDCRAALAMTCLFGIWSLEFGISPLLVVLLLLLGGLCAPVGPNRQYAGPTERPAGLLAYYSYPKQPIEPNLALKARKRQYDILFLEFPSALNVFSNENIKIDYYVCTTPSQDVSQASRPRCEGGTAFPPPGPDGHDPNAPRRAYEPRRPTVLMLPISGGIDFSVESFARLFVRHGINCALVHNRRVNIRDTKSAEQVEAYFRQTVLDNRQVLDYLVTRPDVDPNRIGCLGLSLGGIKTSLVAAVDDRIRCAVLGLAGGSMADITMHSRLGGLRDYVQELLARKVEPALIHGELAQKVRTDPLQLAPYLDARDTLMFLAAFDRVVPTWTGKQLRQALGRPRTVYLLAGHYTSFLYLPYAHWESLCFVKRRFNLN